MPIGKERLAQKSKIVIDRLSLEGENVCTDCNLL